MIYPAPMFVRCADCGASVHRNQVDEHVCTADTWVDYQLVVLRPGIRAFDADLAGWLDTPHGRFAQYLASRRRGA